MQSLLIPRRWTSQPQYPAGIDWTNPITRGLVYTGTPDANPRLVAVGVASRGVGSMGRALQVNGSSNYYWEPFSGLISAAEVTVFSLAYIASNSNSGTNEFFTGGNSGNANPFIALGNQGSGIGFRVRDTAGVDNTLSSASLFTPAIGTHAWAGVLSKSASRLEFWFDGSLNTSGTPNASTGAIALTNIAYGTLLRTSSGQGYANPVSIYCGYVWNRALTASELISISANPWQIFSPALC